MELKNWLLIRNNTNKSEETESEYNKKEDPDVSKSSFIMFLAGAVVEWIEESGSLFMKR